MPPEKKKEQIPPEKFPEKRWWPSRHRSENMLAVEIDAAFYNGNVYDTPQDFAAYKAALAAIIDKAPLIENAIKKKAPDGSALQNLISDFQPRIKIHSKETGRHVSAVVDLTARCVNHLVDKKLLRPDQGADLCLGAIIHDFGKLYVLDKIIHDKKPLPPGKKKAMDGHITYSSEIARLIHMPEASDIRLIVDTHHERLDGNGYPLGLKEDQLPYIARILPIIDTFEAMTAGRKYQEAKSSEEAIAFLKDNSEKYDPGLVIELQGIMKEFNRERKGAGKAVPESGWEGFIKRPQNEHYMSGLS
jgi:HD-GYP domain-containing protein (c-di-GMP phosphodiesterase class II)